MTKKRALTWSVANQDKSPKHRKPDPDGMNDARARFAGVALEAFMRETGTDREDSLGDLLCDLVHWADRNNFHFSAALCRALGYYRAEIGGDDSTVYYRSRPRGLAITHLSEAVDFFLEPDPAPSTAKTARPRP